MLENIKLLKIKKLTVPETFEKILAETVNIIVIDNIKPNDKITEFLKD